MSAPTWDLERVFAGGPAGRAFDLEMIEVEALLEALCAQTDALGVPGEDPAWNRVLPQIYTVLDRLWQCNSFAHCHHAAATDDVSGAEAVARTSGAINRYERAWTRPRMAMARCSDAQAAALCAPEHMAVFRPLVEDTRRTAGLLLPHGEQELFDELRDSTLSGWQAAWGRASARVAVQADGRSLSSAQAFNLLDDPNPATRREAHLGMEAGWTGVSQDAAAILSALIHTRGVHARRLGVPPVQVALGRVRMSQDSLDQLMDACAQARPVLHRYLAVKARLLGKDQLDWWDLRAPVGEPLRNIDWDDGGRLVADQVGTFSPRMRAYVDQALATGCVEAEDRPGKRPGAFCSYLSRSQESRVFMTWSGTGTNLVTLAHELGHAYHNHVMRDMHLAMRRGVSTLAETASTFAEALLRGALLDKAATPGARLALLESELRDVAGFLINIPVRFEFEQALFAQRAQGPLTQDRLNLTMLGLQRRWYGSVLGEGAPTFWARKLHFFLSGAPFYNFPYTFGHLFSGLVAERARAEGPAWSGAYDALLRDTGWGTNEGCVARHLGVQLDQPGAWQASLDRIQRLVDEFEGLADGAMA